MRSAAHLELVRGSITTAATLAHERTLPVDATLTSVVPSGVLQRGSTVAVHGTGATSFGLAVVSEAVRTGSFLAVVAPESFGLAACLDFDIPLRRVVQFTLPSTVKNQQWAHVVAAVVEGFDVVLLADRQRVSASLARQLVARNRERGSVLVRVGGPAWPEAADVRFDIGSPSWEGLGQGHGHLRARQVSVHVAGRRVHGRTATHQLLMPAAGGGVEVLERAEVTPISAHLSRPLPEPHAPPMQSQQTREQHQQTQERYAGADIDALLDSDSAHSSKADEPDLNAPDASDLTTPDLNATA